MEALQVKTSHTEYLPVRTFGEVEEAQIINISPAPQKQLQFIEANTKEVDFNHLKNECVIPVFSKDNGLCLKSVDMCIMLNF